MKRVGNNASNRIYNPQNIQAPINYDANETDAAMERFIRQKYQRKVIDVSQTSGFAKSEFGTDDYPPPLPPKTGPRLGLRSASSILPLSSHHNREVMQQNETYNRPNLRRNKPSRVFGITVEVADDYQSKNLKLCEMGFIDQSKNRAVLKELGGDLEKSIETLVCSGEKNVRRSKQTEKFHESRSISTTIPERLKVSYNSSNPFALESMTTTANPQSSQSTGVLQCQTIDAFSQLQIIPNSNGLVPSQSSTTLDQKFQQMPLNKSQSLFPNRTGPGFAGVQVSPVGLQQKSLTPPVPYLCKQYHSDTIFQDSTHQVYQNANYNPFSQPLNQVSPIGQTKKSDFSNHYHLKSFNSNQSPTHSSSTYPSPLLNSDYSLQQLNEGINPYQNKPKPFLTSPTSFATHVLSHTFNEMTLNDQLQAPQSKASLDMPKASFKFDSRSILDLYNYPHLAPDRPDEKNIKQNQTTYLPEKKDTHFSLSTTNTNSNNPFACDLSFTTSLGQEGNAPIQMISRNLSQENLSADGGWMNGRHSPEAWRSISARSMG